MRIQLTSSERSAFWIILKTSSRFFVQGLQFSRVYQVITSQRDLTSTVLPKPSWIGNNYALLIWNQLNCVTPHTTWVNRDWTNTRKLTALISLKDWMEKEAQLLLEDGAICELSVLSDLENEDSTHIKWKIRIFDHPKNLIKVLRTRLAIFQGISGNNITTGPNQYCFTQTFLDRE